jgi:hypothetical protein
VSSAPREVTDAHRVKWSCLEAYGGLNGERAETAAKLADTQDGTVAVVCTPSAGAPSVRLDLPASWTQLSEADLLAAIARARSAQ